jgi:carboxymethylenebutenolidase
MATQTQTIELTTADGPMALYEAVPDAPKAAVIVIQEAFGVNDHIEDVTRRFADVGYHAVAPHLFHRAGGGTAPYDDFSKVLPLFEGLTDEALLVDVDATIAHLKDAGFNEDRIAIVGFCMGGRVTFLVAVSRALGAAAGFYGGGIVTSRRGGFAPLIDRVGDLKTPWLGLFGDKDGGIPIEDVERLRTELSAVDTASDIVRYADAEHGFHCDKRPSYNPEASKDAWGRTLDWFEQHVAH